MMAAFSAILLIGPSLGWFTTKGTDPAWDQITPGSFSSVWGSGDYFYACGTSSTSGNHAFLAKGDAQGNFLWNQTWDTPTNETGLQVWGNNQSVFIGGQTFPSGLYYVSAWDHEGNFRWNQTFGFIDIYTSGLKGFPGIWCDQTAVYASWVEYRYGIGHVLFLSKWDNAGVPLWMVNISVSEESYQSGIQGRRIWGNGNAIYVGWVSEHLEPTGRGSYWIWQYFMLVKWQKDGTFCWSRSQGVGHQDATTALWGDDTGIYLCGNDGGWIILMKWDENGHVLWVQVWEGGYGVKATNLWSQGRDLYLGARVKGTSHLFKWSTNGTLQWILNNENGATDSITGFPGELITCGGVFLQRWDVSQRLFGISPLTLQLIPVCISSGLLVLLAIDARRKGMLRSFLLNIGNSALTLSFVFANTGLFIYFYGLEDETAILALAGQQSAISHGEWWRLFTSLWMHWDPIHLVENMIGLAFFGYLLENVEGLRKSHYLAIYLGAGFAGSVATYINPFFAPAMYSLGASGCIFGVLAADLFLRGVQDKKGVIAGGIYIVYNFVTGMLSIGVNVVAHMVGIFAGLVIVALLTKETGEDAAYRRKLRRRRRLLYNRP